MFFTKGIAETREIIRRERGKGKEITLVPTMGYLHAGHQALAKAAKESRAFVVMSIFVNPLQFGPNEDYACYPRDLDRDMALAEEAGVDLIFNPGVEDMYPTPNLAIVQVNELGEGLCGKSRPGHFQGVGTVVSKLLNIVQPDRAYFGQKDYQQVAIVRRMVADLNVPVEIVSVPTVRESDGLALSSRNVYLNPQQRAEAPVLNRCLAEAEEMIARGERNPRTIESHIRERIGKESSGVVDYVEIRDAVNLSHLEMIADKVVIALAVKFDRTRLIDNRVVEV